jgi:hypothetical protein
VATLQVAVELDDGYTYTTGVGRITGAARESLDIVQTPQLLQFSSSVPSAVEMADWGDAELLLNHWAAVEIDVTAQSGCVPAGQTAADDSEGVYSISIPFLLLTVFCVSFINSLVELIWAFSFPQPAIFQI